MTDDLSAMVPVAFGVQTCGDLEMLSSAKINSLPAALLCGRARTSKDLFVRNKAMLPPSVECELCREVSKR